MNKKSVIFVINPISGGVSKARIPELIEKYLNHSQFTYEICYIGSASEMNRLCNDAVLKGANILVAVGGDGTVNCAAKAVCNSDTVLAILPMGSGNGFARHLKIPTNPQKAIQLINSAYVKVIDTGMANDHFFVNVAGAGFDAHISQKFASASKRGLVTYAQITLREFAQYKPLEYEVVIDNKVFIKQQAFLICVGNGSQYGNNAYITPSANECDGRFEMSILKPFKPIDSPTIVFELFTGKFTSSKFVDSYSGDNFIIKRAEAGAFNIDGEAVMMQKDVLIRLIPKSVNIIVPKIEANS